MLCGWKLPGDEDEGSVKAEKYTGRHSGSGVLTICGVQIQGASVAALPWRHQVEDESHPPALQLIVVTQQDVWTNRSRRISNTESSEIN